jgi:hypothetical protein
VGQEIGEGGGEEVGVLWGEVVISEAEGAGSEFCGKSGSEGGGEAD